MPTPGRKPALTDDQWHAEFRTGDTINAVAERVGMSASHVGENRRRLGYHGGQGASSPTTEPVDTRPATVRSNNTTKGGGARPIPHLTVQADAGSIAHLVWLESRQRRGRASTSARRGAGAIRTTGPEKVLPPERSLPRLLGC